MNIRRLVMCLAIFISIIGVSACSHKTADRTGEADTVQGKDGSIVSESGISSRQGTEGSYFTQDSTVREVITDSAFGDFGRLLFPVDFTVPEDATLSEISSNDVYVWYSDIQPEKTVEIVNYLKSRADAGEQIYFPIYSENEIREDASKADTGLFYFGGSPGEKFAIMNAGAGLCMWERCMTVFPMRWRSAKRAITPLP